MDHSSKLVRREPPAFPFLQLPADVLLLISDYLDLPATLHLSLSCRGTYALLHSARKQKLQPEVRELLLLSLEKDPFGRGTYYCHSCNALHPFEKHWGPLSERHDIEEGEFHCGNRNRFSPIGNAFELTYTHARLAMNRHLYGPDHGIPLGNLCLEHSEARDVAAIHCSTAARIWNNELFLLRTYAFTVDAAHAAEFRRCTGARDFRICEHTSFFPSSSVSRQHVPELHRRQPGRTGGDDLVPCTDAPGSCGLCLMDYDITIAPAAVGSAWSVEIHAYHDLGGCRSPDDWKWARFTESSRPHLFFPNRPNRRSSPYYPGAIKKRWLGDLTEPSYPGALWDLGPYSTERATSAPNLSARLVRELVPPRMLKYKEKVAV
ncbi:hypothetical protein S40285_10461 [Stachybotrys chlorohalonatus IBT 40285]|uniref:F-box domain-containing protein n=1 Tax=Stachybotrys chlorohalonatus (strain IBT 40285) TaxID=1283841 RepID=A0A084QBB3_STAC4|nr:hypothetical protein S40285_10461 [Stachybotrys chlorohalonata IBT 40285]